MRAVQGVWEVASSLGVIAIQAAALAFFAVLLFVLRVVRREA